MKNQRDRSNDRAICDIAQEIRKLWKNVSPHALPYLNAMDDLMTTDDEYGCDSAESIIAYFLSNATSWKGDDARRIKAELNKMVK